MSRAPNPYNRFQSLIKDLPLEIKPSYDQVTEKDKENLKKYPADPVSKEEHAIIRRLTKQRKQIKEEKLKEVSWSSEVEILQLKKDKENLEDKLLKMSVQLSQLTLEVKTLKEKEKK